MTGKFEYKAKNIDTASGYLTVIEWEVSVYGVTMVGESKTIRAAYRHARRAVRRHLRMWHYLNPAR